MGFENWNGAKANPNGRPKKGTRISDHLQDLLCQSEQSFSELKAYLEKREKTRRLGKITMSRLLACRMIELAFEGNAEIMKEILNRVEGKVKDELSLGLAPIIALQTNVSVQLPIQQDVKLLSEAQNIRPEQKEND